MWQGRKAVVLLMFLVLNIGVKAQQSETLIVFAASSLANAFEAIAIRFEAENPDVDIIFNFASSSDLAAQLTEGADADVFASANIRQAARAREAGRLGSALTIFAKNRLIIIVPDDNPAAIMSIDGLAYAGVSLVVAAPDVPARIYTDLVLTQLAADPAYGEAYRMAVIANIVSEEQNVRQVAAKIALGEADAGIVYVSDVTPDIADQVMTIAIPDSVNTLANYPIAITNDAAHSERARAFVAFVASGCGQQILQMWNFIPVRRDPVCEDNASS